MTRHGFASRGKSHRQKQEEEVQRALSALAKSCDSSILPWFMLAPVALCVLAAAAPLAVDTYFSPAMPLTVQWPPGLLQLRFSKEASCHCIWFVTHAL